MRFERSTLIGSVLLLTVPLFALLHSIATLRVGKKNSAAYLLIALCFFFIFIKIPPLADLYRHFANYDATYGSLGAAIDFLFARGAQDVTAICILGAPEGVAKIEELVGDRDVTLVLGALDERLNEKGYIVPGLGDAGDRLYGTA